MFRLVITSLPLFAAQACSRVCKQWRRFVASDPVQSRIWRVADFAGLIGGGDVKAALQYRFAARQAAAFLKRSAKHIQILVLDGCGASVGARFVLRYILAAFRIVPLCDTAAMLLFLACAAYS